MRVVPLDLVQRARAIADGRRGVEFFLHEPDEIHGQDYWKLEWASSEGCAVMLGGLDERDARRSLEVLAAAGLTTTEHVWIKVGSRNVLYRLIQRPPAGAIWVVAVGLEYSTGRAGDGSGRPGDEFMRRRVDGGFNYFAVF